MNKKIQIGFIGIGVMGAPIIKHLLDSHYRVYGFTRTKKKATSLIEQGLIWCDTIKEVVKQSDVIFTMLGFPEDVETIYFGTHGIFEYTHPNQILIDMTTSKPSLANKIFHHGEKLNVNCLDAPVTGGDIGAQNGTLTMMVGGEKTAFDLILPILQTFCQTIEFMGGPGNGQHTKMANQTAIAANLLGMAEALAYAQAAKLNETKVMNILTSGSAASWQLINNGPKALSGDYSPGFYVKHFSKDMNIALEEIARMEHLLPGLKLVSEFYLQMLADGHGDLGTQSLLKHYQKKNNK